MQKREPRKTLGVLDKKEKPRPRPIPGMTRYGRTVWVRVVKSHPFDQFPPGTWEVLRAYCEACSSHKRAVSQIKKQGEVITTAAGTIKRNPWTLERDACAATMASLSTKLQLNVNSTIRQGKPKSKISPREKAGLLFGGKK